jgi:hypothetical protein
MRSKTPAEPLLLPADQIPLPELLAAWVLGLTTAFGFGLATGTNWGCLALLLLLPPALIRPSNNPT